MDRIMAEIEALWAKHHVHLAQEPPGERSGVMLPDGSGSNNEQKDTVEAVAKPPRHSPLTMVAVGDSMVAGCGVADQRDGLVPDLARGVAVAGERPVDWHAYGKLGATMRRVRYRFLPAIEGHSNILFLCAGSNDIMARRSIEEWSDDLEASVVLAQERADHLVVLSAGQVHRCPALGHALQRSIEVMIDRQTAVTRQLCEREGAVFVDLTHAYDITAESEFWGADRFHPSGYGYQRIADLVMGKVAPLVPQW